MPIEQLGCTACHGPTDADGNPYPDPYPGADCIDCRRSSDFAVSEGQCLGCHGRQKTEAVRLAISDVHRDAGMLCWDCHTSGDMHGDGTVYQSMLEPGAIDADCEGCHTPDTLPTEHAEYDPHGGALHCTSCHTQSVISCYNCHFESQVEAHVKRAKQPISGYVMLVNREKDGKVHPATFQSLSYQGTGFAAFAPYTAHTITGEGRTCSDCHANAVVQEYNSTGRIRFAEWDEAGKELSWKRGVVPIPEDFQSTLRMDFITFDGDPSTPAGQDNRNWSSIDKDSWDGSQMFFATPMTRQQMNALGFAHAVSIDIKPGSCPNSLGLNKRGVIPVAILGSEDLDVREIDVSTLELGGASIARYAYADVGGPHDGDACGCGVTLPDGYEDLSVKVWAPDVFEAIGERARDDQVELTLTGQLEDGTAIVASDCVVLRGGGGPARQGQEQRGRPACRKR